MDNDDWQTAAAISHLAEAIKILAGGWIRDDPLSPEDHMRLALDHVRTIEKPLRNEAVYQELSREK